MNQTYQNEVVQYLDNDSWKSEQDKAFLKEVNFLNNENPKWEYTIDGKILQETTDNSKGMGIGYITYIMIAGYIQKQTPYQRNETLYVMSEEIHQAQSTKKDGMEQWYDEKRRI